MNARRQGDSLFNRDKPLEGGHPGRAAAGASPLRGRERDHARCLAPAARQAVPAGVCSKHRRQIYLAHLDLRSRRSGVFSAQRGLSPPPAWTRPPSFPPMAAVSLLTPIARDQLRFGWLIPTARTPSNSPQWPPPWAL